MLFSDVALPIVLRNEGLVFNSKGQITDTGYVNDPRDFGGETNYGITQNTYDSSKKKSIKNITVPEVLTIYQQNYWLAAKCDKVAEINSALAINMFDCAVNCGVSIAIKILQDLCGVTQDGIVGPVTLEKLKTIEPTLAITLYALKRTSHYAHLAIIYPKNQVWLPGWIARNYRTYNESKLSLVS